MIILLYALSVPDGNEMHGRGDLHMNIEAFVPVARDGKTCASSSKLFTVYLEYFLLGIHLDSF